MKQNTPTALGSSAGYTLTNVRFGQSKTEFSKGRGQTSSGDICFVPPGQCVSSSLSSLVEQVAML